MYISVVLHLILLGVCVTTYWKAAGMEEQAGFLQHLFWAGMSATTYFFTWLVMGFGWPGIIGGQLLLLLGIGVVRALVSMREVRE